MEKTGDLISSFAVRSYDIPSYHDSIMLLTVSVILASLAVFMNGCLIIVIWRTKLLQTCTNMFILSLITSELLAGAVGALIVGVFGNNGQIGMNIATCESTALVQTLGRTVSTLSLLLMCVDRAVAVTKPLRYVHIMTRRFTSVLIIYSWIHGLVFSLLPFFGLARYVFSPTVGICVFEADSNGLYYIKEGLTFFLPTCVIIISVLIIIRESRFHHRVFAIVPIPAPAVAVLPGQGLYNRRSTFKSMKGFFLILIGYTLLCLPYYTMCFVSEVSATQAIPDLVLKVTLWLTFSCCIINPLAISLSNRKFRIRFKQLFLCFKIRIHGDHDGFTVTTGLQNVIEASLVAGFFHQRDDELLKKHIGKRRTHLETAALLLRFSTASGSTSQLRTIRQSAEFHSSQNAHVSVD